MSQKRSNRKKKQQQTTCNSKLKLNLMKDGDDSLQMKNGDDLIQTKENILQMKADFSLPTKDDDILQTKENSLQTRDNKQQVKKDKKRRQQQAKKMKKEQEESATSGAPRVSTKQCAPHSSTKQCVPDIELCSICYLSLPSATQDVATTNCNHSFWYVMQFFFLLNASQSHSLFANAITSQSHFFDMQSHSFKCIITSSCSFKCISTWTGNYMSVCPLCKESVVSLRRTLDDGTLDEILVQKVQRLQLESNDLSAQEQFACLDHAYFQAEVTSLLRFAAQVEEKLKPIVFAYRSNYRYKNPSKSEHERYVSYDIHNYNPVFFFVPTSLSSFVPLSLSPFVPLSLTHLFYSHS